MRRLCWASVLWLGALLTLPACSGETPYTNPPPSLRISDIAGTWEGRYGSGLDTLIIGRTGNFRQIYQDRHTPEHSYETDWKEGYLEILGDGRARLHLPGARYYPGGPDVAERDGMSAPCPERQPDCWGGGPPPPYDFWDPIGQDFCYMRGELILNVQRTRTGDLVLLQMLEGSDGGWISLLEQRAWYALRRVGPP